MAVVTATGMETEIGHIADMMNDAGEKKHLSRSAWINLEAAWQQQFWLVLSGRSFFLSIYRGMAVLDA